MPDLSARTAIATYLSEYTDDQEVLKLLAASLGRVLGKFADRGVAWRTLVTPAEIIHITDWLTAARINKMSWLRNTDETGRPLKLAKFGTVEQITNEADKAMRRMAAGMTTGLADGDEVEVMRLEDGYSVVRMLTPAALDVESARMQHCIGQGAYDIFLSTPGVGVTLYSLRDKVGNPHATVQVGKDGEIHQVRGKQNRLPLDKYIDRLAPFFTAQDIFRNRPESGFVFDAERKLHRVDSMPEGIVIPGDFALVPPVGLRFPKRMTVLGDMSITDGAEMTMPEELLVHGDFKLFLSRGFTPFRHLDVGGLLTVGMCTAEKLAVSLRASGLSMIGNLVGRIADHASICGDVTIDGGGGYIGDDYKGLIDIDCLREIGGSLTLRKTPLTNLPDNLRTGGSLTVHRGRFEKFPPGMDIGGCIRVTWSWLEELPHAFTCNGDLILTSTLLKALPSEMRVAGSLDIANTGVTEIPDDTYIGGSVVLSYSKVVRLPDTMKVVDGTLDLSGTVISTLPSGLYVAVDLITRNSALSDVPDDIVVSGMVLGNELPTERRVSGTHGPRM